MKPNPALADFLTPYDPAIQAILLELRAFILDTIPDCNELIWDNYNALAIAYSQSEKLKDAFCHLAVYSKHVNLGFNRGAELTSVKIKLEGKGKLIRHLKVKDLEDIRRKELIPVIKMAVERAQEVNPELITKAITGKSLVMSVAEKKIRPNRQ